MKQITCQLLILGTRYHVHSKDLANKNFTTNVAMDCRSTTECDVPVTMQEPPYLSLGIHWYLVPDSRFLALDIQLFSTWEDFSEIDKVIDEFDISSPIHHMGENILQFFLPKMIHGFFSAEATQLSFTWNTLHEGFEVIRIRMN